MSTASVAAPPAPTPPLAKPTCKAPLDVDSLLEDLSQVRGAEPHEAYNRLLVPLGFVPLEVTDELPAEMTWSLEEAKVQDLLLRPGGREVLLSLRFDYGTFRSASRVVLLERRGKTLCPLSLALSRDIEGFSCLSEEPPVTIEPQRIVSAKWDTLLVSVRSGACDGYSTYRGAHHEVELWGFVGDEFKQLFLTETYDAWYNSPTPPLRTLERTLEFTGEPPKRIWLRTEVTCDRLPEHDPGAECVPEHEAVRLSYQNGSYGP